MTVPTWVFVRGTERLTIQRPTDLELCWSSETGEHRSLTFASLFDLVKFQLDLEDDLLDDGWTLTAFTPERREGPQDRRTMRRAGTDRRQHPDPRWPSH